MCHQSDTTITEARCINLSGAAQRRRSGNSPKNDCRATWASHRSATPVIRQAAEFPSFAFPLIHSCYLRRIRANTPGTSGRAMSRVAEDLRGGGRGRRGGGGGGGSAGGGRGEGRGH